MIPDLEEGQPIASLRRLRRLRRRLRQNLAATSVETQEVLQEYLLLTELDLWVDRPVLRVWIALPCGGMIIECSGN